jgi:hypothetical protein
MSPRRRRSFGLNVLGPNSPSASTCSFGRISATSSSSQCNRHSAALTSSGRTYKKASRGAPLV